ncbi:MAG: MFS transporter [Chloroflexi bacterium]|nr:MFS transporter [Chloroflexota bacterium]
MATLTEHKKGIFYGWIVLVGASVVMLGGNAVQFSFGYFFPYLLQEFGWSRSTLSLGFTIAFVTGALSSPFIGTLLDRVGARRMIFVGAIIGALATWSISLTREPWHFYLTYGVLTRIGVQIASGIPTNVPVRRWFMRRAGLAQSLAGIGLSGGLFIGAPMAEWLNSNWGWRNGYLGFAIFFAVLALIGGAFIVDSPEKAGTYPDGIKPTEEELKRRRDFAVRSTRWSMKEVLRTPTFWLLVLTELGYMTSVVPTLGQVQAWGRIDLKLDGGFVTAAYSAIVLAAIAGRIVGGWTSDRLMDRWGRKPILWITLGATAFSMLFAAFAVRDATTYFIFSVIFGIGYGCGLALWNVYVGDLFGVVNLPIIMGVMAPITTAASASATFLYALLWDATGTYTLAFLVSGLLGLIGMVFLYFLPLPKRSLEPRTASTVAASPSPGAKT